jgi:hypothetical protein
MTGVLSEVRSITTMNLQKLVTTRRTPNDEGQEGTYSRRRQIDGESINAMEELSKGRAE